MDVSKSWRHRAWADRGGDDDAWARMVESTTSKWTHLDATERQRHLEQTREFDRTRYWESLGDVEVTSQVRASVAARACLLTVNIGLEALRDVTSIILAPTSTVRTARHSDGPMVHEGTACVLGESMMHGPVRIALDRVMAEESPTSTTSVVLHEFAHKIDMVDGASDGIPPVGSRAAMQEFAAAINETLDEVRSGRAESPLRAYAATNRQELFAVATEAFFLVPEAMVESHPKLTAAMASFYRQHPERRSD